MPAIFTASVTTFTVAWLLVLSVKWHGHFSLDDTDGVQKMHAHATPRIGGIAIMIGLILSWAFIPADTRKLFTPMLLASIPAFLFGLLEDFTRRISVRTRLLATMTSGTLACLISGIAMQNTGIPWLDYLFIYWPLAVLFTAFATAGIANAINIIDGFNGLSSGSCIIMLSVLGTIAFSLGDAAVASLCLIVASSSLGFLAVNWPWGRIFLGDGGAYLLGFILAWACVLIPMRHPEVTGWTMALVCAYPTIEVFYSIRRRLRRKGHYPGQPDQVHLHHLIYKRVVKRLFPRIDPRLQNGFTSPICWCFVAAPGLWAFAFKDNKILIILGYLFFTLAYISIYTRLATFRWWPLKR